MRGFSLQTVKTWLSDDCCSAQREADRHRLESGSNLEQDESSEDFPVDPESPPEEAGERDARGLDASLILRTSLNCLVDKHCKTVLFSI